MIEQILDADAGSFNTFTNAIRLPGRNVTAEIDFTAGATPTVTVALQGSDDGVTFHSIIVVDDSDAAQTKAATKTFTATGRVAITKANPSFYEYYRLLFSANTNMTVNSAFLGCDE